VLILVALGHREPERPDRLADARPWRSGTRPSRMPRPARAAAARRR
jgi:hypothetical protein